MNTVVVVVVDDDDGVEEEEAAEDEEIDDDDVKDRNEINRFDDDVNVEYVLDSMVELMLMLAN